jgi:hypothetical protein
LEDVRRIALALPNTEERPTRDHAAWWVGGKLFVWERPLRRSDIVALGDRAPAGPVLGLRVGELEEKEELIALDPDVFFTTPHFDGYPAILAELDKLSLVALEELISDAWLVRAPARLVRSYLERGGGGGPQP